MEKVLEHKLTEHYRNGMAGERLGPGSDPLERFLTRGFNPARSEEYRHTPMPFLKHLDAAPGQIPDDAYLTQLLDSYKYESGQSWNLIFVNGQVHKGLSNLDEWPQEIQISEQNFETGEYHSEWDPFQDLVQQSASRGYLINIAEGFESDRPVHLIYLGFGASEKVSYMPVQNEVHCGSGSRVSIIESAGGEGEKGALLHTSTRIIQEPNSRLDMYWVWNSRGKCHWMSHGECMIPGGASFHGHALSFAGDFVRHNLRVKLTAPGAEAFLNGLYVPDGHMVVDNHLNVVHDTVQGFSKQLYKGILSEQSRSVFHGRIRVEQGAQQTNAYQSNNNILLDDTARINTKPQLEIFADDVKCSHGATCAHLDDEWLFYLRARGLGKKDAQTLLLNAFAGEVLRGISLAPLREELEGILRSKLNKHKGLLW